MVEHNGKILNTGGSISTNSNKKGMQTLFAAIFLFFNSLGIMEILPSSLYFPSKLNIDFESKLSPCIGKPLPRFRFNEKNFDPSKLRETFQALRDRSRQEGRSRSQSVICIRNLKLSSKEKEDLKIALDSYYKQEKELFFLFSKFVDNAAGINRSRNPAYLKSRYDLMVILQTKTDDWVFRNHSESEVNLEEEFSSLYLSILRTHYDYLVELGENGRSHYFQSTEGSL